MPTLGELALHLRIVAVGGLDLVSHHSLAGLLFLVVDDDEVLAAEGDRASLGCFHFLGHRLGFAFPLLLGFRLEDGIENRRRIAQQAGGFLGVIHASGGTVSEQTKQRKTIECGLVGHRESPVLSRRIVSGWCRKASKCTSMRGNS